MTRRAKKWLWAGEIAVVALPMLAALAVAGAAMLIFEIGSSIPELWRAARGDVEQ